MITSASLQLIASSGGSVIVSATNYTASNLQLIAHSGKAKGANLVIKDANKLTASSCQLIASANPGHVYFDFITRNGILIYKREALGRKAPVLCVNDASTLCLDNIHILQQFKHKTPNLQANSLITT